MRHRTTLVGLVVALFVLASAPAAAAFVPGATAATTGAATTGAATTGAALPAAAPAHAGATTAESGGVPAAGVASDHCTFPYTATDATGTEVTVDAEPERIVVTQASAAQVAWDVGAREKVVGMPVREYTSYLDGASERTDVLSEDGFALDTETIVSLDPDLVLVPNATYTADPDAVDRLRETGLTVYVFPQDETIEGIYAKIELVGRLTGECDGAQASVERMRSQVETIQAATDGQDRPRVLYTFYNYTAGEGTFIHEIIRAAGGENVAAEAGISGYQKISRETVADRNPEWVVIPSDASFPSGPAYTGTVAYQQGNRLTVDANLMNQPGPRVVGPMTTLAKAWHPEAYAQANATTTTTTTTDSGTTDGEADATTTAASTATSTTSTTTTTSATGPGFGVVASVLALAAAGIALLGRRD